MNTTSSLLCVLVMRSNQMNVFTMMIENLFTVRLYASTSKLIPHCLPAANLERRCIAGYKYRLSRAL